MDPLIHYILVRRDLPFGVTLAMVAHAAAESNTLPKHCTVCVLGVKNLKRLRKVEYRLEQYGLVFFPIRESDMPWNGQLMAIGVVPGYRDKISQYFEKYETYKVFEGGLDADRSTEVGGGGD